MLLDLSKRFVQQSVAASMVPVKFAKMALLRLLLLLISVCRSMGVVMGSTMSFSATGAVIDFIMSEESPSSIGGVVVPTIVVIEVRTRGAQWLAACVVVAPFTFVTSVEVDLLVSPGLGLTAVADGERPELVVTAENAESFNGV